MAPRKKVSKEKTAVKKTRTRRKSKKETPVETVEEVEDEDVAVRKTLHGEMFWEYRAKTAEYEKVLLEFRLVDKELKAEKSDPKYQKLLKLMADQERMVEELRKHADLLRGVQVKTAQKLGLDIETFLKECTIDHETGVVTIF